jgi:hypothetical protein
VQPALNLIGRPILILILKFKQAVQQQFTIMRTPNDGHIRPKRVVHKKFAVTVTILCCIVTEIYMDEYNVLHYFIFYSIITLLDTYGSVNYLSYIELMFKPCFKYYV